MILDETALLKSLRGETSKWKNPPKGEVFEAIFREVAQALQFGTREDARKVVVKFRLACNPEPFQAPSRIKKRTRSHLPQRTNRRRIFA